MNIKDELANLKYQTEYLRKIQSAVDFSTRYLDSQKNFIKSEWKEKFGDDWSFCVRFEDEKAILSNFTFDLFDAYDATGIQDEDGNLCIEQGWRTSWTRDDLKYAYELPKPDEFCVENDDVPLVKKEELDAFATELSQRINYPVEIKI